MEYDMFQTHAKVILWRTVVNDAVVGDWQELPDVREHTENGLKEWMSREKGKIGETWDGSKLVPGGFDHRLRNYGLRLQFWIPDEPKLELVEVVCEDVTGLDDLTPGKRYNGVTSRDGLYEIEDDRGQKKGFFKERFRRIGHLHASLA